MNDSPIPLAVLKVARLKFKRKLAAVIIEALADSGMSIETVEARLEMKSGEFIAYLSRLLQGEENGLNDFVDIATATGYEIEVGAHKLAFKTEEPVVE